MLNPSNNFGAYIGMAPTQISSANIDGTGFMLNERAKYTANTGMVKISVANSNLDGTGTLGTVLTAASNGTLIDTITIKAIANTSLGMVRLFLQQTVGGITTTSLLHEVEIPYVTQSAIDHSFSAVLNIGYNLKAGDLLLASTENAESFIVIADGRDWTY